VTPSLGKALADAVLNLNQTRDLPLDTATGRLKVHAIGTLVIDPAEDSSILYQTAQPPAALDHFASLPAGAGAVTNFIVQLTSAGRRVIQIHQGIVLPAAGARPWRRTPAPPPGIPSGGEFVVNLNDAGIVRPTGHVVVTSSTQDTFTDIVGTTELMVTILGRTT
jgi:hypothetical protein